MKSINQLIRLIHINYILAKNGLDQVLVSIRLFSWLRFIVFFNPWNWFRKNKRSRGEALRITLEELGPIFVKFGQALSTRPDILPEDIAIELCKLQDKVPPFSTAKMLRIVEDAFGHSVSEVFQTFDTQVLASASIAQVHAATLKNGTDVVVKVLRPKIRNTIHNDLNILHTIAALADRYWPESKRFKPKEIVREFENNLIDELDLQREAANAGQLRRNFQNSSLLYIPEVYWDYVRENVLVMERIYGIPVTDIATLKAHNINIKKLAERGIEIFFTQVFRDCFFHADMHPGNIFVSYQHPEDPQYICIDFGIIGTLSEKDKRYLAENLVAFFNRDYKQVARLHIESGWISRDTRAEDFEMAIRTVCEPIFEKPLKDISFALVVVQLFQVARRFHMEVQPQLVLLQKTLLAVEGLGRQLYPDLDLWATAKPFLENWLREQMGPKKLLKHLRENLPFLIDQLPHMPRLFNEVLSLSKEEKIMVLEHIKQNNQQPRAHKSWYRGFATGLAASFIAFASIMHFNILSNETFVAMMVGGAVTAAIITLMFGRKTK